VDPYEGRQTVAEVGLENGSMLYLQVDETKMGVHEKGRSGKRIAKDGHIVAQEYTHASEQSGFRPGMLPLRSMKMHWTLNEFNSLDEQFVYRVKAQEKAVCKKVSLDTASMVSFQQYMWSLDYRKLR
jgi:nuclear protein localization family protein 4